MKAYRIEVVRTKIAEPSGSLDERAAVVRHCRTLEQYDREHLVRLDLDNRNRVICQETVSIGTADAALVNPREVFRGALLSGAVKVIILHNHPSGDPEPSAEDEQIARRLQEAGQLLCIPMVDFLIIGEDGKYCSVDGETGRTERGRVKE